LTKRRIRNAARQLLHHSFTPQERFPRRSRTISRGEQLSQRGVAPPFDQGHRMCLEKLQGTRQLFLGRVRIAIH